MATMHYYLGKMLSSNHLTTCVEWTHETSGFKNQLGNMSMCCNGIEKNTLERHTKKF
jgi:hypothetical protein